jgi:ribose transport system permease protein
MTVITETRSSSRRHPVELIGGWELGLIVFMVLLYLAGAYVNPGFFGKVDAFVSLLRDSARYGVMAVGMTFVIVNKDLDLSVGSTYGLVATIFSLAFSPAYFNDDIVTALVASIAAGMAVGLINGILVTVLKVPAFIATLTMLFIGRGLVLGLTGGKTVSYLEKAKGQSWFFSLGETNAWGFNNQIFILLVFCVVGLLVLAKTRW